MFTRTKAPAILLVVIVLLAAFALPAGAQDGLNGKLTLAGSSALLPMMQEAATQFQKANPGVQITVTGGGSGAGRKQVCAGQIDIGNSDVRLTGKEKKDLSCGSAVETPVAIQAFAPVANKTGPGSVASLSRKQLQDIFTGKITNWKDVGGDNQPIVLINRAKGSGTRAVMARYLFDGPDKFAVGASEEDNSQTVLQTVAQTPGAISYLGFAYLDDPSIVAMQIDDVAPTRDDIMNGKWPIVGIGYSITKGQPNALANAFLSYVISSDFQNSEAFNSLGYVPVNAPKQISSPKPGATVSGNVDVVGTTTTPNFNRWQLDILANQSDQNVISLGTGKNETKSPEKLTTIDTTKLPNGIHTLRLRLVRNDSNYNEYRTTLNIQN
ncbi:MAG: phosphate ABC transporter substrate-binding protein [Caldilineaceae bacterium]